MKKIQNLMVTTLAIITIITVAYWITPKTSLFQMAVKAERAIAGLDEYQLKIENFDISYLMGARPYHYFSSWLWRRQRQLESYGEVSNI